MTHHQIQRLINRSQTPNGLRLRQANPLLAPLVVHLAARNRVHGLELDAPVAIQVEVTGHVSQRCCITIQL